MTPRFNLMKSVVLASVLAVGAGTANANEYRFQIGNGYGSCSPRAYRVSYAGEIRINGCTTKIRADRSVSSQIAKAFRRAGYYAHVSRGCVIVDYSRCDRPRVRWCADGYNLSMRWGHDSARFSIQKRYRPGYRASNDRYDDWNRGGRRHRQRWGR
jgi:hypothetical protein